MGYNPFFNQQFAQQPPIDFGRYQPTIPVVNNPPTNFQPMTANNREGKLCNIIYLKRSQ